MNDSGLQPLVRVAGFVYLKIPLFRKRDDLPGTGDVDTGLIWKKRLMLFDKSHAGDGKPVAAPNRKIHQHDARINVALFVDRNATFTFHSGTDIIMDCGDGGLSHIEAPQGCKVADNDAVGIEIENSFNRSRKQVRNQKTCVSPGTEIRSRRQFAKCREVDLDDGEPDAFAGREPSQTIKSPSLKPTIQKIELGSRMVSPRRMQHS